MGRDRCGWSDRESYSAGIPRRRRASRLQQCKRHMSVAPVHDGTERCAMVRDAWSVTAAQRSEREHLSAAEEASASEYVSSPTERSVGSFFFVSKVVGAITLGRSVACRTFQWWEKHPSGCSLGLLRLRKMEKDLERKEALIGIYL